MFKKDTFDDIFATARRSLEQKPKHARTDPNIIASDGPMWLAPAAIPTSPQSTPFINIVISRFL